jgi:hypothetical protein
MTMVPRNLFASWAARVARHIRKSIGQIRSDAVNIGAAQSDILKDAIGELVKFLPLAVD